MKERDSSKSIDDIFASVSRLGRKGGATEPAAGRPSEAADAEALADSLGSTIARAAKASATGHRSASLGDEALFTPDRPPLDAVTSDAVGINEGDLVEQSRERAGHDRLSEGVNTPLTAARAENPESSTVADNQGRGVEQTGARRTAGARGRALVQDLARRATATDEEGSAAELAPVPAPQPAQDEQPARLDELTAEERRAVEQAAAQSALLARHRADAAERVHLAEEERRAAEKAAPLARERALAKKRASLFAATEEGRRAAELVAARATAARERAHAEELPRLAALAEEERRAAEEAAAAARERAQAEELACLAALAEVERRATEEAAASEATAARERAQAEELARLATLAEEERRAAEEAAASEATAARERAQAEELARLATLAEEERRAAEEAAASEAAAARERAQAEELARVAALAEKEERQAAARETAAELEHERAGEPSEVAAPRTELAAGQPGAAQEEAQTLGASPGRSRAITAVAIAAALVMAASAFAFLNRGSREIGAAAGGASSSGDSAPMLRSQTSVPSTSSTMGPGGSPAESAVAPPRSEVVPMVAEPSDSTAQWVARQLSGGSSNAASSSVDLLQHDSWLAGVQALAVQPRVMAMRYDVLQAAREAPRSARVPDLEVIAPIGTEPLFFVVRRDSPLRFIHELQGRAINVGAADGARARTARNAYHRLFNDWPAASTATALDENAALDRLAADDRSLDAVTVLGASPLSTLARRAPLAAHGLRLLALDDDGPADQRLLATFLSIPVSDPALSGKQRMTTPGIVSFLVTARGSPKDPARHDDFVRAAARSLCENWTAIGQSRAGLAISPELQADVGWPYAAAAQPALARCGDRSNNAAVNLGSTQTLSR